MSHSTPHTHTHTQRRQKISPRRKIENENPNEPQWIFEYNTMRRRCARAHAAPYVCCCWYYYYWIEQSKGQNDSLWPAALVVSKEWWSSAIADRRFCYRFIFLIWRFQINTFTEPTKIENTLEIRCMKQYCELRAKRLRNTSSDHSRERSESSVNEKFIWSRIRFPSQNRNGQSIDRKRQCEFEWWQRCKEMM